MIETELRIGNLINDNAEVVGIVNGTVYVKPSERSIITSYRYSQLKPIPLTEEWLKKLPKNLKLPKWIKYVHQAQNWYYWNNKQKELEIKI